MFKIINLNPMKSVFLLIEKDFTKYVLFFVLTKNPHLIWGIIEVREIEKGVMS